VTNAEGVTVEPDVKMLLNVVNENGKCISSPNDLTIYLDTFYIESVLGMNAANSNAQGVLGDGSSSPTSKKDLAILERRGNITTMSKSLNEHMYLVVRSLKHMNNKIDY
jgi:hypothetical protein